MVIPSQTTYKVAILDLYEGQANQGMRCIREILAEWGSKNNIQIQLDEFNVREHLAVPSLDYDLFISSGGPGSPLDTIDTKWEAAYFSWLTQLEQWNNSTNCFPKKHAFFICHSFQLLCRHYVVGVVCIR